MSGVTQPAGRPHICLILFQILFNLTSSTLLHLGKASELALHSTSAAPHPQGASFFGSPVARNYSKLVSKLFKNFFLTIFLFNFLLILSPQGDHIFVQFVTIC